ncbi:hypothetical protein ACOSP7_031291 [Xanthoceras sorbifolium]
MSYHDQQQAPVVYPPTQPVTAYPPPGQAQSYPLPQPPQELDGYTRVAPPPPIGYPTRHDKSGYPQHTHPVETKSRGDDFLKGCFAALCCCCVLDACCF